MPSRISHVNRFVKHAFAQRNAALHEKSVEFDLRALSLLSLEHRYIRLYIALLGDGHRMRGRFFCIFLSIAI